MMPKGQEKKNLFTSFFFFFFPCQNAPAEASAFLNNVDVAMTRNTCHVFTTAVSLVVVVVLVS